VATWADIVGVAELTGATVTDADLAKAGGIVDLFAGRTYAAVARTGTRDAGWLRMAVAYQAAWMSGQPDLFARLDYTAVPDAAAVTGTGMVLAPMAKWALRRCSWLKSRSLHVRSPFLDGSGGVGADPLAEANDGGHVWAPMGGGW